VVHKLVFHVVVLHNEGLLFALERKRKKEKESLWSTRLIECSSSQGTWPHRRRGCLPRHRLEARDRRRRRRLDLLEGQRQGLLEDQRRRRRRRRRRHPPRSPQRLLSPRGAEESLPPPGPLRPGSNGSQKAKERLLQTR